MFSVIVPILDITVRYWALYNLLFILRPKNNLFNSQFLTQEKSQISLSICFLRSIFFISFRNTFLLWFNVCLSVHSEINFFLSQIVVVLPCRLYEYVSSRCNAASRSGPIKFSFLCQFSVFLPLILRNKSLFESAATRKPLFVK